MDSNIFEQRRYAIILDMMRAHRHTQGKAFQQGLEVGCAAGVFTALLAPHCQALHVVDVMPAAIERAAARLKGQNHVSWEVASAESEFADGRTFDLIVVAEVLCYLPDHDTLRRAVDRLSARLAPGGLLIFGSAVDETTKRWGLLGAGAETTMAMWESSLREVYRAACVGDSWGENTRIVAYTRDAGTVLPGASFATAEETLIPHKAVTEISATRVVVLAPHADDEVLGCGGAIAAHVATGVPVTVVIATDGAYGEKRTFGTQRAAECSAAADILGYGAPVFWNLPDRGLAYGEPLINKIADVIVDADLIYAPALTETHPDHRILAMAAVEAVKRKGGGVRLAFYEVSAPLRPNVLLNISAFAGLKQQAVACYRSELARQRYDEQIAALNRYRTYTLVDGTTAAEAYIVVSAQELSDNPMRFHRLENEQHLAESVYAQRELQRLQRLLADRERELTAMRRSTSWKLTAPLRKMMRILRPSPAV